MNAADLYRKAFACLSEAELSDYSRLLGRDAPDANRLVELGRGSLDLLHQAACCAECNWGAEAALGVPVDDFSGGRRLAMLALLRAEGSFRKGDDRAGLDDLAAVMALGRHIGRGKYVSGLAGFPIEDLGVTKALEILNRADAETRRGFAARLDSLPAFPEFSQAVGAEKKYFHATQREPIASLDDADVSGWIEKMYGLPAPALASAHPNEPDAPRDDLAARLLRASGETRSGLLKLADDMLAEFDTLIAIAEGVESDGAQTLSALRDRASANPLVADQLQSFDNMRPVWDRFKRRFASPRSLAGAD